MMASGGSPKKKGSGICIAFVSVGEVEYK
jgi:hypothetical protein